MIMFDEHPSEVQERKRRASSITVRRFGSRVAAQPFAVSANDVIRPIELTCRHCAQRERLGGSSLCVSCLDMKIRLADERREFRKNLRYVAVFALIAIVLLLSLRGWMEPSGYQRTDSEINRSGQK